ncbi:MAG: hypothetical protein PVI99_00395 [Anaerolineales bacterium]
MLTLLPVFALLGAAFLITMLGIFRPRFVYHWLLAVFGALLAWGGVWYLHIRLPLSLGMLDSSFGNLPLPVISFHVDEITWTLALAVSTLTLAVLLTDVGRAAETSWVIWAGDLGLGALGVAAVLSGDPGTLLLAWMMIDTIELGILLRQVRREDIRRRVLIFFTTNVLGSMMVIGAIAAAGAASGILDFNQIPSEAQIYLILAVGLRMGVFPLQAAFLQDVRHQRGQGTLVRLISPAASLSLLVHTAAVQTPANWRGVLLFFSVLAASYGAVAWARAQDEVQGRTFWIIATAGFAFTGAIQSQQSAAHAWALAIIYPGAYLFLSSIRTRQMLALSIFSLLTLSALPYTPISAGLSMYQPFHVLLVPLVGAQAVLLVGFLRHMMQRTPPLTGVEPWIQVVYLVGLVVLPFTHIASVFMGLNVPSGENLPLWPLLLMLAFLILGTVSYLNGVKIPDAVYLQLDKFFSLRWTYTLVDWGFKLVRRVVDGISFLLEGEGGVLWTLVILAILISLLGQFTAGGGL